MSYQEYSQFGKGRRRERSNSFRGSELVERPYHASHGSFSVPRQSPPTSHSSNSSLSSTSLSPSNSASQKGLRRTPKKNSGRGGRNTMTLAQLRELEMNAGKKPDLIDVPLPWRPFYLQRRIMVAFFAIFAAIVIALEALLDYSSRNAGLLGPSDRSLRYLSSFGPTAILILIAALWSRAEYQAKITAPWSRLARGPAEADKSLLLDYVSMSRLGAVSRAVKNRDFTVACTTAVSLILSACIVLSTAMISLTLVYGADENAPITIQTEFVNNASALSNGGSLALFTMLGLEQDNLTYPDGTSRQFAYQQFVSDLPATTEFQATVDGFSAMLSCEVAQLTLNGVQRSSAGVQFNTSLSTPKCSLTVPISSQSFSGTGVQNRTHYFGRFDQGSCNNSTNPADQRIVVVFGTASVPDTKSRSSSSNLNTTVAINGTISQSQQLICTPSYSINQVDVVRTASILESIGVSDTPQPRVLDNVQPWDIARAVFDSYRNDAATRISDTSSPYFQPQIVNVDASMYLAFGMLSASQGNSTSPADFLDPGTLEVLANDYFQQYTALLAHNSLVQPASIETACTAVLSGDRLAVGVVVVQIIVVLLAFVILLNTVVICLVPSKGLLPRDPGSIMNKATLLAHSKPLLQCLRGTGGADLETLRERLEMSCFYTGVEPYDRGSSDSQQGYFKIFGGQSLLGAPPEYVERKEKWRYPFGLRPWQRVFVLAHLPALIAGLEATLRMSDRNTGFANVEGERLLHYVWTILPAIAVSILALYFVSVDFCVRALIPYAELSRQGSFESMTLNYLDRIAPVVLYKSLASRRYAVFGATAAMALSSLLVVFASTLLSAVTIPVSDQVALATMDFFSNSTAPPSPQFCTSCTDGMLLSSLILNANLSYPAFTYRDLAFPSLQAIPIIGLNSSTADIAISAAIPAARSSMACQFFDQSQVIVNLTTNYTVGNIVNPLRIDLPGEPKSNTTSELLASGLILATAQDPNDTQGSAIDPNAFFGLGGYRPFTASDGTNVSQWVYAWGQLSNANTNQTTVKTISALACNESMQQVSALVTFMGSDLLIDPSNPPQPIESTAAPSEVALSTNLDYSELVNITTPHLLDGFFGALVSSQFAIPVADLASTDPATSQGKVAAAITAQHRLIRAQVVNTWNRRATTESSLPSDVFPTDVNSNPMGNATELSFPGNLTSVAAGVRRLVQDAPSTRALQVLLAAVFVLSVLAWVAFPGPAGNRLLPPRPPTSIASTAALLADGNVFGFLGRGAEWQTSSTTAAADEKELRGMFRDGLHVTAGFALGWQRVRRRRREESLAAWASVNGGADAARQQQQEVFGINTLRTGGWGGGESVGLGLQARVGYSHREYVRDWGWRT